MAKNSKRTINAVILFLTSFIYFFLAYKGYKKQHIDLSDCDRIVSMIIDKGVGYRYGSKGKSKCFYIELSGVDKKLGVYRMRKNYDDLIKLFNVGDTVRAYFRNNSNQQENINIDLVQVEKGNQILLPKKEYERKEGSLIYIGLTFGILTVILSFLYYKGRILRHSN
ncbi:MAG: hypothetical protein QM725_02035 [Lacibacter sp.]